jgi:hypothetical protein
VAAQLAYMATLVIAMNGEAMKKQSTELLIY